MSKHDLIRHYQTASLPIQDLNEAERAVKLNELVIKIHACTGWSLPSKEILIVFVDQFRKKILESYRYLNAEEIEFAFRHYGSAAKDFGKNMNLAIIDEVIQAYLDEKNNIPRPISESLKKYE